MLEPPPKIDSGLLFIGRFFRFGLLAILLAEFCDWKKNPAGCRLLFFLSCLMWLLIITIKSRPPGVSDRQTEVNASLLLFSILIGVGEGQSVG
jgi:hypothetical protein